ncbi:hypothetical protein FA95DRAFT_1575736 [Auriscalpium vulgare]|uniref:Uncharacterized protein n=1 Tax=Auriscalpium vulgare TaxID=40419 RepID=A0ACB8RF00_9AGAM|nr:hypothetical protein FA95DRAFT_1575736 [Auriscalpium vulgare]
MSKRTSARRTLAQHKGQQQPTDLDMSMPVDLEQVVAWKEGALARGAGTTPPPGAMDTDDDPEPMTPTQPTFSSAFATMNPFAALDPSTPATSTRDVPQAAPSVENLREQLNNVADTPAAPPAEGLAASMHAPAAQRAPTQPVSHTLAEEDAEPDPFPALVPPFRIPQPTPPRGNVPVVTHAPEERNALICAHINASANYVSTANLPDLGTADPLALTSPPFPAIHHLYPAQAWEGVQHSQVEAWHASTDGHALLLRSFATTAHLTNNQQLTVSNIGRVLSAYIGLTNPQIFPPIPLETAPMTGRLPKVFLIKGLTAAEAAAILDGNADVLATVIKTWNKPATLAFFDELMESTMTSEKPLTVTQLHPFLSSIEAVLIPMKATDDHPTHRFSIVAKSVTLVNDDHWFQLVEHFKSLRYPSNFHGTGVAARPSYCHLCNGCDHPHGLCTFPQLTGWNGEGNDPPPPQQPHSAPNQPNQGEDRYQDRRRRNKAPYNDRQRGQHA